MRVISLRRSSQRGDTIVEVLISVAIISLVLASSYAIANRSTGTNQDTQEHNQAQQIVQRQIEELRAMAQSSSPLPSFSDGACVVPGGTSFIFSNNTTACNFVADGSAGGCTNEPCYQVTIKRSATEIYSVAASWDNVHGETSRLSMEYGI